MSQAIQLPAVRGDISLTADGKALRDPVLQQQIGLDSTGQAIVSALQQSATADALLHSIPGLTPALLARHVRHLSRHGLFEGPRAEVLRRVAQVPDDPVIADADRSFAYAPGLQHACQACGSCCSATDVGPIPDDVAAAILEHDWREEIPALKANEDVFRHEGPAGEIRLMAMRDDQCVFLGQDKLCLVHKTLGVDKKPTPCRQFPFVFARTGDQLAVSLSTECRAWWKARQAASPPSEDEPELRTLLSIGAPVHEVPPRLRLDSGLLLARSDWLGFVASAVAGARAIDPDKGVYAPIVGFARAAELGLMAIYADIDSEERPWASSTAWRAAYPQQFGHVGTQVEASENFEAGLARFDSEMASFTREGGDLARERDLHWLAARFGVLGRASASLCGGADPFSFRFADPEAAATILGDVIVSGLQAHEPVRRGATLRAGLAHCALRALLTLHGACARAKDACRVEVTVQDLVDSMVTIGKMLRERAVLHILSEIESVVISLFLTNLEVFARTASPRLESPGGIR
ncbi:MAG: Fe-S-cluster containining protein [Myxococcota bacterium]|jgi:Fe-S-cluster containining protein